MIRLSLSTADKKLISQLHTFVDKGVEFQMPNVASLGTGKQMAVVYLEGEVQSHTPFRLSFESAVVGDARVSTYIDATILGRAQRNFSPEVNISEYVMDAYKAPKVPVRAVVFRENALLEMSSNLELLRRTELEGVCLDDSIFTAVPGFQFLQAASTMLNMFPGDTLRLQWVDRGFEVPILVMSCQNVMIYTGGLYESHAQNLVEMVQFL